MFVAADAICTNPLLKSNAPPRRAGVGAVSTARRITSLVGVRGRSLDIARRRVASDETRRARRDVASARGGGPSCFFCNGAFPGRIQFFCRKPLRIPLLESRDHCARRERGGTDMSWIYGSSGGTGFWDEQCKSERRIKEKWATTFGVDLKAKKEAEVEAERAEAAKAEADRLAREDAKKPNDWRSRPKPWEVKGPGTWKTVIKPTGMTRTWVPTTSKKPPPGVGI